jgi:hypothetical protein
MNKHPRSQCIIMPLLCGLAILLLTSPVQAQITIQDGSPLAITRVITSAGTAISSPFTVSSGASVMVVVLDCHPTNATQVVPEPATLTWNGQTLTRDTNSIAGKPNSGTDRSAAIYHLYNPPPGGPAAITGTLAITVSSCWLTAYTLSNVDTTVAPLVSQATTGITGTTGTNLTTSLTGVTAGSWAAVGSCWGTLTNLLTLTGTGGTATTTFDTNDDSTSALAGYVTPLSAGAVTIGIKGSASTKACFVVDLFTPYIPPTPPSIVTQPSWSPATNYAPLNPTTKATVVASGSIPFSYQWFTNSTAFPLADSVGHISGSASNILVISNAVVPDSLNYIVIITNLYGSVTSSAASLVVLPVQQATNFLFNFPGTNVVEASSTDWNTVKNWNPAGLSASNSAIAYPGSTFELLAGSRLRSPTNAATFPNNKLTLDGSGVFENATNNPINVSELRFKNNDVTNTFSNLVLSGGELDAGNDGVVIIQGSINVASNSTIYVDTSATKERGFRIDSTLTGGGNLFWHQLSGSLGGTNLQITGTGNTFTGQWVVDQGALVGVGVNSLGTNNITVSTNGLNAAVETMYDISNTTASLILGTNGSVFLHQNDTFAAVSVNGNALTNGTYSFSQLNSSYPTNFPASWALQAGSTFTTGSGQITVGSAVIVPPTSPHITGIQVNSGTGELTLSATNGTPNGSWALLQSTNLALPLVQWLTNATGSFDGSGNLSTNLLNTATNKQEFYLLKVQ